MNPKRMNRPTRNRILKQFRSNGFLCYDNVLRLWQHIAHVEGELAVEKTRVLKIPVKPEYDKIESGGKVIAFMRRK